MTTTTTNLFIPYFFNHSPGNPKSEILEICFSEKEAAHKLVNFFFEKFLYDFEDLEFSPVHASHLFINEEQYSMIINNCESNPQLVKDIFYACTDCEDACRENFMTFGNLNFGEGTWEIGINKTMLGTKIK